MRQGGAKTSPDPIVVEEFVHFTGFII